MLIQSGLHLVAFIGRWPAALLQVLLALICLSLMPAMVAAAGKTVAVSTSAELYAALNRATGGETILLAAGNYGALSMNGKADYPNSFASTLKIMSADAENPAVFTWMRLERARNIEISGVIFDYVYKSGDLDRLRPFEVNKSQNVSIMNSLFIGSEVLDGQLNKDGFGSGYGLSVREGLDITIEGNEFMQWSRGAIFSNIRSLTVRNNEVHNIRSDGMDFVQVQNVLIEGNYYHDFRRPATSGDHPDMIQFWTNGTNTPSTDIVIRNNILNAGWGDWTQSIFMRNEEVDAKGAGSDMFYRNVTIIGNVIINAHLHGITLGESSGVLIADNTLVRNPEALLTKGNLRVYIPTIRVASRSRDVVVARNITAAITGAAEKEAAAQINWQLTGNLLIQNERPDAPGYVDTVFVAPRHGNPAELGSFAYLPDGPAGGGNVGAPMLRLDALAKEAETAPPLVQVMRDERFVNRFTFDARLTPDAQALSWRFDDGASASGALITHDFPGPGRYSVTARRDKEGAAGAASTLYVNIPDPVVLRLSNDGLLAQQAGELRPLADVALQRLSDGTLVLRMGVEQEPLQIGPSAIAGFFGAGDLQLDLRLRAGGSPDPTGEILRIHNNLVMTMTPRGQIDLQISTAETSRPVSLATAPLRLFDGAWHDVSLRYDAQEGLVTLMVDGVERSRVHARGRLRPMESHGLSFGNPFGQRKNFAGDISVLELKAGAGSFAPWPDKS